MKYVGKVVNVVIWGMLLAGCSDPKSVATPSVSGSWCGAVVATPAECKGDEVEYLELTQNGDAVTGRVCEAYEKDCYDVQAGAVQDGKLTLFYEFDGNRVDVALDVGVNTLMGAFSSSKCACSLSFTLHRIP
jgi:hypothetical protein